MNAKNKESLPREVSRLAACAEGAALLLIFFLQKSLNIV
jgi:hypothetical protein